MKKLLIARPSELTEGNTIKFEFVDEGVKRQGFAARFQGKVVAYENVCRHLPLSLDHGHNRFFTVDGKFFVCQTHWALYEPLSGYCVQGPCQGASLKPLEIEVEKDAIWFVQPEEV